MQRGNPINLDSKSATVVLAKKTDEKCAKGLIQEDKNEKNIQALIAANVEAFYSAFIEDKTLEALCHIENLYALESYGYVLEFCNYLADQQGKNSLLINTLNGYILSIQSGANVSKNQKAIIQIIKDSIQRDPEYGQFALEYLNEIKVELRHAEKRALNSQSNPDDKTIFSQALHSNDCLTARLYVERCAFVGRFKEARACFAGLIQSGVFKAMPEWMQGNVYFGYCKALIMSRKYKYLSPAPEELYVEIEKYSAMSVSKNAILEPLKNKLIRQGVRCLQEDKMDAKASKDAAVAVSSASSASCSSEGSHALLVTPKASADAKHASIKQENGSLKIEKKHDAVIEAFSEKLANPQAIKGLIAKQEEIMQELSSGSQKLYLHAVSENQNNLLMALCCIQNLYALGKYKEAASYAAELGIKEQKNALFASRAISYLFSICEENSAKVEEKLVRDIPIFLKGYLISLDQRYADFAELYLANLHTKGILSAKLECGNVKKLNLNTQAIFKKALDSNDCVTAFSCIEHYAFLGEFGVANAYFTRFTASQAFSLLPKWIQGSLCFGYCRALLDSRKYQYAYPQEPAFYAEIAKYSQIVRNNNPVLNGLLDKLQKEYMLFLQEDMLFKLEMMQHDDEALNNILQWINTELPYVPESEKSGLEYCKLKACYFLSKLKIENNIELQIVHKSDRLSDILIILDDLSKLESNIEKIKLVANHKDLLQKIEMFKNEVAFYRAKQYYLLTDAVSHQQSVLDYLARAVTIIAEIVTTDENLMAEIMELNENIESVNNRHANSANCLDEKGEVVVKKAPTSANDASGSSAAVGMAQFGLMGSSAYVASGSFPASSNHAVASVSASSSAVVDVTTDQLVVKK